MMKTLLHGILSVFSPALCVCRSFQPLLFVPSVRKERDPESLNHRSRKDRKSKHEAFGASAFSKTRSFLATASLDEARPSPSSSPLVFLFNGQGSQWNEMGKNLIQTNEVFSSTMERLQASTSLPLLDLYKDGSKWLSKEYSSIGIVSFQLGLLAILEEQGIRSPDFFLGHSIGELVCPYLAELASEEEVLQFAAIRAELVTSIDANLRLDLYEDEPLEGYDYVIKLESCGHDINLKSKARNIYVRKMHKDTEKDSFSIKSFSMDGQMVVVGCSVDEIDSIMSELGLQETRVACYNAPLGQTVSGASFEVDMLVDRLRAQNRGIFCREVDTDSVAYHAIFLEVFRDYLRTEFCKMMNTNDSPKPVVLPKEWISTSRNDSFNFEYIIDNMLHPVYFQEAIESLPPGATIVEIGPSTILLSQVKRIRSDLHLMSLFERKEPASLMVNLDYLSKTWSEYESCEYSEMYSR